MEAVSRLREATVAMVGCGGVGTVALQHLVGGGVRKYRLFDCDYVELSNFNRQFIYASDAIGMSKADAAGSYVSQRIDDAQIETLVARWDNDSATQKAFITEGVDLVVAAVDHPSIESSLEVADTAWAAHIPSIVATVGLEKSLISQVFDPGRSPTTPRASLVTRGRAQSQALYASHGPTNTLPATVAADQVLHHLAGIHDRVNYERPLIIQRQRDGSFTSTRVENVWI